MTTKIARRFKLEQEEGYLPVLVITGEPFGTERLFVHDPQQLFLEVVSVLGPWLQQPGVLPSAGAGGELFENFREVMSDLLDVEKEEK